ncbi:phage tail protein [Pseudomonas moraviensis]|uniref:tail fiber assembly protein n=1 Tax=Pseudomonas moraviensis TaxID=321662 RepID=UPI00135D1388|nr:tail fiber assembly protein [Pseudomonas moraviensis]MXI46144.1 phage tail protein [Pseudomonas moraviensis]
MITYLIDAAGALSGPVTFPPIPGFGPQLPANAVQLPEELAPPKPDHAWSMVKGKPQQILDLRGTVFRTEDGAAQAWDALGELPQSVTRDPWPGEHFIWKHNQWVVDTSARRASQSAMAIDQRDSSLQASQLRIAPLQYAEKLGTATPSELKLLDDWMRYSVELNRIEQQEHFPEIIEWPIPPSSLQPR